MNNVTIQIGGQTLRLSQEEVQALEVAIQAGRKRPNEEIFQGTARGNVFVRFHDDGRGRSADVIQSAPDGVGTHSDGRNVLTDC